MQDSSERLRAYMRRNGLSQTALALEAGVGQSTVWRALNSKSQRQGAARHKLFTYAKIDEWIEREVPSDARERVIAAVERVWDGTEDQAVAIVKLFEALADLYATQHRSAGE